LRVVRLLGHAGSDIEATYRSADDIEETEASDPLCHLAELLVAEGLATPDGILEMYGAMRKRCDDLMVEVTREPKIQNATEVVAPLAPRDPEAIAELVSQPLDAAARTAFWQGKLPEDAKPGPLGLQLNRALGDLLVQHSELLLFGEDVAHKGGVYGITRDLARRAKRGRVFDTLLDEQTILGIAIGAGQLGCLPIPEIQYLAYLHNAEDQLRGEAASMQFFSQGQFRNPMVVRIAAYAYQKGFGGHFHNDNAIGVLRDIPGIVIASPARGDDAVAMLQTCVAAAKHSGAVCVFLEPIALYPERDLHEKGDGGWCCSYDPRPAHVPIGRARAYGEGEDILIVSWANGLWQSLRVAARLEAEHQIRATVLDLRWLSPLPIADLLHYAGRTSRVLIVDETRKTGGVSEGLIAALIDEHYDGEIRRVAARDSFIPLGPAADHVLIQEADIERAVLGWDTVKNDA
jgi:2-oxoisovalerate dehydrogenase E1 component